MKTESKIKLAELIIRYLQEQAEDKVDMPVMIGTLRRAWSLNGFKKAEIGNPVFEYDNRYLLYLETLNGDRNVEVPFYKETLAPQIEFYEQEKNKGA